MLIFVVDRTKLTEKCEGRASYPNVWQKRAFFVEICVCGHLNFAE